MWVTIEDVAAFTKISVRQLYRLEGLKALKRPIAGKQRFWDSSVGLYFADWERNESIAKQQAAQRKAAQAESRARDEVLKELKIHLDGHWKIGFLAPDREWRTMCEPLAREFLSAKGYQLSIHQADQWAPEYWDIERDESILPEPANDRVN